MREPVPPPSPELCARVAAARPVRTRVPLRTLVGVLALSLLYGACALLARPLRADLPYLSVSWLVALGVVWLVGFVAPLAAALLPRRGAVVPDLVRASRAAAVVAGALVLVGFALAQPAPESPRPDDAARAASACIGFSLRVWAGVLVLGMLALRRVVTVGAWRPGAALGAAGGALAGLILHLICPYGEGLHVGLAHGGGVAVCAILGAATCPLLLER